MTNTLTLARKNTFVYLLMTVLLGGSLLLALMPTPARAAQLTEPQIAAIVNLLVAFNADSATVSNVDSILHNQPAAVANTQTGGTISTITTTNSGIASGATSSVVTSPVAAPAPQTGAASSAASVAVTHASSTTSTASGMPICVLVANTSTVSPGQPVTLTWKSANATYSSSPHGTTGANGAVVITPTVTTIYQKTVYGPGGSAKCQVTVSVSQPQNSAGGSGNSGNNSTAPTGAVNTQMVMAQPQANLASMAAAVAELPFALAISSLTNILVELGIGQ